MQCSVRGHSLIFFYIVFYQRSATQAQNQVRHLMAVCVPHHCFFLKKKKKKKKKKKNYYGFI